MSDAIKDAQHLRDPQEIDDKIYKSDTTNRTLYILIAINAVLGMLAALSINIIYAVCFLVFIVLTVALLLITSQEQKAKLGSVTEFIYNKAVVLGVFFNVLVNSSLGFIRETQKCNLLTGTITGTLSLPKKTIKAINSRKSHKNDIFYIQQQDENAELRIELYKVTQELDKLKEASNDR